MQQPGNAGGGGRRQRNRRRRGFRGGPGGSGRTGQERPRKQACVCPNCGKEQKHEPGVPCHELKCPDCGMRMIRGW